MTEQFDILVYLVDELKLRKEPPREYDVAEWNLILAQGLPGAEDVDIPQMLGKLDDWAHKVKQHTDDLYPHFIANPSHYENSQGYFCILILITVLERDLGVRYNPERVKDEKFQDPFCIDPDVSDSRDLFIHGILDGPGGTCSSMPVVYTAVGRRLGYPMKLVEAPGHLFSRWDDPQGKFNGVPDVFNIDASGHGFASHPDERYKTWPRKWTDWEIENDVYLNSHNPYEEIAGFLAVRASCHEDNGQLPEAKLCFHYAYQLTGDMRFHNDVIRLHRKMEATQQHIEAEFKYQQEQKEKRRKLLEDWKNKGKAQINPNPKYPTKIPPLDIRDVGHGHNCICPKCTSDRVEVFSKLNGDFGHGPSCTCLTCTENRQIANQKVGQFGFASHHIQNPHFP